MLFHYNGPTCDSNDNVTCPEGFHYFDEYAIETESNFKTVEQILNVERSCNVTKSLSSSSNQEDEKKVFFGVRSFVTPPSQTYSAAINSYDFAKKRNAACSEHQQKISGNDRNVNFVYADFWFEGDLPRVAQEHNAALAYTRRKEKALRKQLRNRRQ